MDARTLKALKASIAKWERNAVIENTDDATMGPVDCPLCVLFHLNGCVDCPVFSEGHYQCDGTPYDAAYSAWRNDKLTDFLDAAREEVAFLKSLLPAEEI